MKICKVFTTFFGPRRPMFCSPTSAEEVLISIKKQVELERSINPGLLMDIILVNNENNYNPGDEYLKALEGTASHSGIFKILNRSNIGGSFGGFSHAFLTYGLDYDYYIFSEDDLLLLLSSSLKKL